MTVLLYSLWPLFALIVGGYLLRRHDFPGEAFWPAAERLNYFTLFPALLFSSLRGWPAARFGAFTQGILRFNTYIGLAVIGSLHGQPGLVLAALLLALMVPAVNVLSVWSLSADRAVNLGGLLLPILKNPLILACLAGMAINLLGIGLPGGSDRLLGLLAAASLPLGLLCVGAALRPQELRGEKPALAWNCTLRLLAMPLLAYAVARALHLPALESSVLVLFFALPTAPTAYVLTRQLGGDGHLMAGIITLQTLLAALSLPLVLILLAA